MKHAASSVPSEPLSLYHLLEPEVLADPYPLFEQLRSYDPVYWDPFLHVYVLTRYDDVLYVLNKFSAERTPTAEQLAAMGMADLGPIAQVMVRQLLFLDPPAHTRLRALASAAFAPSRVARLRFHIGEITNELLDKVVANGRMDMIADLATPLPAAVTAEMLGLPACDRDRLKSWSADFAEMLGNFQHNPGRAMQVLRSLDELTHYLRAAIRDQSEQCRTGLIGALLSAEQNGDKLTEDEVIANTIITMVGGLETTTNMIGNGLLALLRHPESLDQLRADRSLIPSAVEEILRYDCPSQHTARLAPADCELGGKSIRRGQGVIAVMAAANRDPERFPEPNRFNVRRTNNRHLAFGWGAHFCFGAALARIEGQVAFDAILRRLGNIKLDALKLEWRNNLGLRGLVRLPISFGVTDGI